MDIAEQQFWLFVGIIGVWGLICYVFYKYMKKNKKTIQFEEISTFDLENMDDEDKEE